MTRRKVFRAFVFAVFATGICSAVDDTNGWRTTFTLPQNKFMVGEPVPVIIERMNLLSQPQACRHGGGAKIDVSFNGKGPQSYYIFETVQDESSDIFVNSETISPQRVYVKTVWLLLGRVFGHSWEFMFKVPGYYSITFPGYNDKKVEFDVVSPFSAVDVSGQQLFSVAAAKLFLNEEQMYNKEKAINELQTICINYDTGRYAPYAAWTLARRLWDEYRTESFDWQAFSRYLNIIIEKHPESCLREDALYLLARSLETDGQYQRFIDCAARLVREFPQSSNHVEYVNILKSVERVKKLRQPDGQWPKPVLIPPPKPASLKLHGMEKVSNGPREVFEDYWKACAMGKLDAAATLLRNDYFGSDGDSAGWRVRRNSAWEYGFIEAISIDIGTSKLVRSYILPQVLPGKERKWDGDVYLIDFGATHCFSEFLSRKAGTNRLPLLTMAMQKTSGVWRIISEYVEPSQSSKLATLVGDMESRFSKDITNVTIWNGQRDAFLKDEILSRIDMSSAALTLEKWHPRGELMTGDQLEVDQLTGDATVTGTVGGNVTRSTYTVTMRLSLDAARLRLLTITVQPAPPPKPENP